MLRVVTLVLAVVVLAAACTSAPPPEVLGQPPLTAPEATASTTTSAAPTTTDTSPETSVAPTFVFHGGPLLTMDDSVPTATGLAVTGNEITAVGDEDEIVALAGPDTVVVDLEGKALLPGFVDAHSHYFANPEAIGLDQIGIQDHMLSEGLTTVGEAAVDSELLSRLGRLYTDDFIRPRVSVYLEHNDGCGDGIGAWIPNVPPATERGERLRIGGVKIFVDGGSCNAPAVSTGQDAAEGGDLYLDEVTLTGVVTRYNDAGLQVLVHALGDRAVDVALRSLTKVNGEGGNPLRHRIDHNAVVPPEMRDRYDDSAAVATIFGSFPTCAYLGLDNRFQFTTPVEYQEWEWPWRDLIDLNPETTFAWHGDFPVFADSTPLGGLHGLVTRSQTLENGTECLPEPDHLKHAITVEESLELMTMGAAYALGRDDEVGSLEVGKLADLVVLSADPTSIPTEELSDLAVELTILDGEAVFCTEGFATLCAPQPGGEQRATASAALLANPPNLAVDGDVETHWTSAAVAPQWIEVDLGRATSISGIRLVVNQSPIGFTRHIVSGRSATGELTAIAELAGETDNLDVLELVFDEPVTTNAVRIETVESPAWVSWAEIEVIPAE